MYVHLCEPLKKKKKKNWLKKGPRIEAGNPEQREDGYISL